MREFQDETGRGWIATAKERPGFDYKGRWTFVARPVGGGEEAEVTLADVRWNSERSARRTLETMSVPELRRRLEWARQRSPSASASG